MDDLILIPRDAVEMFIRVANSVLTRTVSTAPDNLERAEVVFTNHRRKQLKNAVYEAEKALFQEDTKLLTAEQMSHNAVTKHEFEDFSEDKTNFIEGRRR